MARVVGMWMVLVGVFAATAQLAASPPWTSLIPLRRVEADPQKDYRLSEEHGPWMVLAGTFAGDGAEEQARELVLELRRRYNLPAYIHTKHFDYSEPVEGITRLDPYGNVRRMRYQHAAAFDQYAVLVGNFDSVEQPEVERTLDKLRYARPQTLELDSDRPTTQRLAVFREIQRRITLNQDHRERGPMGKAFVTRNPLLPEEFFTGSPALDDFVIQMNQGIRHSLLNNSHKYTVRIATFRGTTTMDLREIERYERTGKVTSKLEEAAVKARTMTEALRERGVEAYEFHDRYESIVTVGGFDTLGTTLPDGRTELLPAIVHIMDQYKPRRVDLPGALSGGVQPVRIRGIACDVQPWPVLVPRRSVATDYADRNRLLR